jgi:hypothetical protein
MVKLQQKISGCWRSSACRSLAMLALVRLVGPAAMLAEA